MQRKIFITINLDPFVKKRLFQKIEKWADFPVKWSSAENFHATLAFLGYIDNEKVPNICNSVKEAAETIKPFEMCLTQIGLGPSEKQPRMIWATGEKSEELKKLVESIEKSLGIFMASKKEFRPHVTLGRIRHEKWKILENVPQINEKIKFIIPVEKVEVLESVMEGGKRKYLLLESCHLK